MASGSEKPLYDSRWTVRNFRYDEDFKHIRSKFLGKGILYEDESFLNDLGGRKFWRRAKDICYHPMFIDGKPSRFDAIQGEIGDCWLIASIEAMTLNNELTNHVVPPDQNFSHLYTGAFHFKIWQLGVWYDVVVDDRLPVSSDNGSLCYAHSRSGKVFWAALLEKAFAKLSVLPGRKATFASLVGGFPLTGLQDLSGGIVEKIFLDNPPRGTNIKWLMNEVFSKKDLMCCSLNDPQGFRRGLFDKHSYAITKVVKFSDDDPDHHGLFLVRIMNPWGYGEWIRDWGDEDYNLWRQIDRQVRERLEVVIRDDGEFWMDVSDFTKRFHNLYVCHLEPGQYLKNRNLALNFTIWRTIQVNGEWIRDYTAAGANLYTRHENPQYMFLFEKPDPYSKAFQPCRTLIDLTQRSKNGREIRFDIAFYIYYGQQMPLTREYLSHFPPVDSNPDFSVSRGRTYVKTVSLQPGSFVIIPCSKDPNNESQFLLRVFSQCKLKLVTYYDTKLSKQLPIEEQSVFESNSVLKRMFFHTSNGSDEVDWIDLKKILEEAMNPNGCFSGIFETFLRYIGGVLELNSLHNLSDECKLGCVIFTKNECRSLIAMLDEDHSSKLNISEFYKLWKHICFWTKVYEQYRNEEEGYVKVAQLRDALGAIGYDVTKRTVHSLSYVYADEQGLICLKDFILCGVTLETTLSLVEKADINDKTKITFTLEEWVKNTLML